MKLRDFIRKVGNPQAWRERWELRRIEQIPRYNRGVTSLFGPGFEFVDSASFLFIHHELFHKHAYEFQTDRPAPRIIDGGANVGLSLVYFKKLYPESTVLAFEADPLIHSVLTANVASLGLKGVTLRNEALWDQPGSVRFLSDHADAGRVGDGDTGVEVPSLLLQEVLDQPVDLLKLDIEGAEYRVLKTAQESLAQVDRLFVEYHSHTDKPQELAGLLQVLADSGFRYYITAPCVYSPKPLLRRESYHGFDMVLNVYGVRR